MYKEIGILHLKKDSGRLRDLFNLLGRYGYLLIKKCETSDEDHFTIAFDDGKE